MYLLRGFCYFSRNINRIESAKCSVNFVRSFSSNKPCPTCGKPLESIFMCENCRILKRVEPGTLSYFDILGVEKSFRLDTERLKKNFLQLQSKLHPDKFGKKTDEQRALSEEYSSLVNKAYAALSDPLKRAEYLLGVEPESSKGSQDQSFLLEMMEYNEQLEGVKSARELAPLEESNLREVREVTERLEKAFVAGDRTEARRLLARFKFYNSNAQRIKDLKRRLSIVE